MRFHRLCKASVWSGSLLGILAGLVCVAYGAVDESAATKSKEEPKPAVKAADLDAKKLPDWDKVVAGTTRLEGLFPLYYNEKEQKVTVHTPGDKEGAD